MPGFFLKGNHTPGSIGFQDAKAMSLFEWYDHRTQCYLCIALLMESDHRPIIHAINMVSGQNENIIAFRFQNETQVLIDRISRALIPVGLFAPKVGLEQTDTALLPV